MREQTFGKLNFPFLGYPQLLPFYSAYQTPPQISWQTLSHYAPHSLRNELPFWHNLEVQLSNVVRAIDLNNRAIKSTLKMLDETEEALKQAEGAFKPKIIVLKEEPKENTDSVLYNQLNEVYFFTNFPLITKIFGREKFKFKLKLQHRFPKLIYKQRKLNLKLKLTNPDGSAICNSNLIHLCVGVCSNDGQWIIQEDGGLYMRGKVEIDLYHGQAEFRKIYPGDISRRYSPDSLNIIVYAKRSVLKFIGQESKRQKEVDPDEIEPLLIEDVIVNAKKKK